jgi:very-short-patch-repair endonuclease
MAMTQHSRSPLAALGELAHSQFGLFTRAQANSLGLTNRWLLRRVRSGLLTQEYFDVLRFTAVPPSFHQQLMAICLRAPGKVWVSHRGAGGFWDLDDMQGNVVEVTSLIAMRVDRRKVVLHRTTHMPAIDVTSVSGIPVTRVHRTLIDLGAVIDRDTVEVALECALRRRITSLDRLWRRLDAIGTNGRRGAGVLKAILDAREPGAPPTDSALEVRFIQLLRKRRLPLPLRQRVVRDDRGFVARVDFEYVEAGVVIEVDSRKHHLGAAEWERDLRRRNRLTSAGKRVLHVTYMRMEADPAGLIDEITRALRLPR